MLPTLDIGTLEKWNFKKLDRYDLGIEKFEKKRDCGGGGMFIRLNGY